MNSTSDEAAALRPGAPQPLSRWVGLALYAGLALVLGCGGAQPEAVSFGGMAAAGAVGSECVRDSDCAGGLCDRTVPDGYCTAVCDADTPCDAGAYCLEVDDTQGQCMATCTSPLGCRSTDFLCFTVVPDELGVCSMDPAVIAPTAPNVGAPCTAPIECAAPAGLEAYCMPEVSYAGTTSGFAGGMCLAIGCGDVSCGDGAVCVPATQPYCVAACTSTDDCREGYLCDGTVGGCVPLTE